jgi:hypothetical protein
MKPLVFLLSAVAVTGCSWNWDLGGPVDAGVEDAGPVDAGIINVLATDDAYVRDGAADAGGFEADVLGDNFEHHGLMAKSNQVPGYNRYTYIKFNLPSVLVAAPSHALLRLNTYSSDLAMGSSETVYLMPSGESFNSTTLTCLNAPAPCPTYSAPAWSTCADAGTALTGDATGYWRQYDVSGCVSAAWSAGQQGEVDFYLVQGPNGSTSPDDFVNLHGNTPAGTLDLTLVPYLQIFP